MSDAMAYAAIAAVSLAPLISVRYIAARYLDAARDVWLVGLAWLCALLLCWHSLPLGLFAIAALAQWRSWEQLPAVMTWLGIMATWLIVQALPLWAIALLPVGWRITVGAIVLAGFALMQKRRKAEIKAGTGTRIMLAALVAIVWPFTAWWEWPLYAYGLFLTSSWVALLAMLIAIAMRYPMAAPYAAGALALVVVLFAIPWTRRKVIDDWTPRGSSYDGFWERWRTWSALIRLGRRWPIWLVGAGPTAASRTQRSLERDFAREAVRLYEARGGNQSLSNPAHCEPLEYAYAYGLLGVAAMGTMAWHLVPRLAFGDPWSASAVAGFVIACAAIPARVAPVGLVWLVTLAVVGVR